MSNPRGTVGRVAGAAVAGIGLALSYNLFSSPQHRIGGHALDVVMWFGPVLVPIGLLVLSRTRDTSPRDGALEVGARPTGLLTGLALLGVPALLLAYAVIARSELAGMLFTLSVFVFGLPGLVLVAVGIYRAWRRGPTGLHR